MTRPVDAAGRRPRVFTIPAGTPFLDRLAGAFLSGALFGRDEPLSPAEIAAARIFVPTRRAGAALTTALLQHHAAEVMTLGSLHGKGRSAHQLRHVLEDVLNVLRVG